MHRVDSISLEHLHARVRGTAEGTWRALGWRYRPPSDPSAGPPSPSAPSAERVEPESSAAPLPLLACENLDLREIDLDVTWRDESGRELTQPVKMSLEASSLAFDPRAESVTPDSALTFTCRLPETIAETRLEGRFGVSPSDVAIEGNLDVRDVTFTRFAEWLRDQGFAWRAPGARFRTEFRAVTAMRPEGLELDARLTNLELVDDERTWLSLDQLELDGLELQEDQVSLEAFTLARPELLARFENDETTVLGVALLEPKKEQESTPSPTATRNPSPREDGPRRRPPHFALDRATVSDARLVIDAPPGVARERLTVQTALTLEDLSVRDRGPRGTLDWTASIVDGIETLHVQGDVGPHREEGSLDLRVDVRGIRGDLLESLLPSFESSLQAGDLQFALAASYRLDSNDRMRGRVSVEDADYRERTCTVPFLAFSRFEIAAEGPLDASWLNVTTTRCEGLETIVQRMEDGSLDLLGLRIPAPAEVPEEVEEEGAPVSDRPAAQEVAIGPPTPREYRAKPAVALPRLRFDEVDLELARLLWLDRASGDLEPVETNLRLRSEHEFEIFGTGSDPGLTPRLILEGAAPPVVANYRVDLDGELLALSPHASIRWSFTGIDGEALLDKVPSLRERILRSDLEGAVFEGEAAFQLELDRRDPLNFALDRPFSMRLDVSRVALRDPSRGLKYLEVDGWSVEAESIDLARKEILITRAEMYHPMFRVHRHADGIEFPGFTLRMPKEEEEPPGTPEGRATRAPAPTPMEASASPEEPAWYVQIDDLALFAGEFAYTDETIKLFEVCRAEDQCGDETLCRHAFRFPVTDLTFQASGLSTDPERSGPLSYEFSVNGKTIPLRERRQGIDLLNVGETLSFFTDVVGDMTGLGTAQWNYEPRPIFNSIRSSGTLDLRHGTVGKIEAHVDDFELFALAAVAKQYGVDINDGIVRSDVELRFRENGTIALDSLTVFSDLDLSEPAGGPIQQFLGLDTPMNQVITLLRDDRGQHRIPVQEDSLTEMSRGKVVGLVAEVLIDLIARAALRSPSRIFNLAVGLTGSIARRIPLVSEVWSFVFGEPPSAEELTPIVIEFAPGDASLPRETEEALAAMQERLETHERLYFVVRHRPGQTDLDRVALMARFSAAQREDYLERLKLEEDQLMKRRAHLLEQLERAIRRGEGEAVDEAREEIRVIDERRGLIQLTLDQLYRMRDIGPQLAQERKARDLGIRLAKLRLDRVREAIFRTMEEDLENLEQRVRINSPTQSNPLPCGGGYVILEPRVVR